MNLSSRLFARTISDSFATVGAKPVKAIVDAHERAVRISEASRAMGVGPTALGAAVYAALDKGIDPATSPEVNRLVTAAAIANEGVAQQIDQLTFTAFAELCHAQADQIVKAWQVPFDAAADKLSEAHDLIGDVPLSEAAVILAKGGQVAQAWVNAQESARVIDTITAAWWSLGEFGRRASRDQRHRALVLAPATLAQWTEMELMDAKVTPWDAMLAGLTLELPTFTEYHARVRLIDSGLAGEYETERSAAHDRASGRRDLSGLERDVAAIKRDNDAKRAVA